MKNYPIQTANHKLQTQCELLQSLEFKKHMAECRGECYSVVTSHVLHTLFKMLETEVPALQSRYAIHNELQAAALLMWGRYKKSEHPSLFVEISIVESIMSAESEPLPVGFLRRDDAEWKAALAATYAKFEGMSALDVFALAAEQAEKGERFIPSSFIFPEQE